MTATFLPVFAAGFGEILALVLDSKTLQAADIDRIVHERSAAPLLAGMLADQAADSRERIVLADQAHCVSVTSLMDKRNIARDVHLRGTLVDTGNRLVLQSLAAAVQDMLLIVIPEALRRPFKTMRAASGTDGTVRRRIIDSAVCSMTSSVSSVAVPSSTQLNQSLQLSESDPARNTFSAGLGMAQVQESCRQIHRTESRLSSP